MSAPSLFAMLAAAAIPAAPASRSAEAPDDDRAFAAFPAAPFRGKFAPPDVTSDKDHRDGRPWLIDAAKSGADFAGHYHMLRFGCGMFCTAPVILDGFTGKTSTFPLGGDANPALVLHYRVDSRLVRAFWTTNMLDEHAPCRHADFVLVGHAFRRLPGDGRLVPCPSS